MLNKNHSLPSFLRVHNVVVAVQHSIHMIHILLLSHRLVLTSRQGYQGDDGCYVVLIYTVPAWLAFQMKVIY